MTDDDRSVVEAAGGARIFHAARLPTVDRGHGIRSTPLVGGFAGSAVLSTGYTVIPPGASSVTRSTTCGGTTRR